MRRCARRMRRRSRRLISLETARARRTPIEWRAEDLRGAGVHRRARARRFSAGDAARVYRLDAVLSYLGAEGRLSAHSATTRSRAQQARQLFAEANALLDRIIDGEAADGAGCVWVLSGECGGRRCGALRGRDARERCWSASIFCGSRRTGRAASRAGRWRILLRRRKRGLRDHIGAFAVTSGIGLKELADRFQGRSTTTTTRSWRRRWPIGWRRRLRNACTSACAMSGATACDENLSNADLIHGEVSRDPAGAGLSGVSGSHGEGHDLAAARCGGEDRDSH